MLAAGAITATTFNTESCCDYVTIGGTSYRGTSGPQSVRVAENELFTWQADYSVTNSGWVLCWRQTGTEPAPTTTTTTTMTITDFDNDFEPVYIILIVMAVGLMVCICICAHQKKKKRSAVLAATADQVAVRRAGWGPRLLKKLTHQDDKVADSPPNCLGSACCCFSCLCLNEDRMTPPTQHGSGQVLQPRVRRPGPRGPGQRRRLQGMVLWSMVHALLLDPDGLHELQCADMPDLPGSPLREAVRTAHKPGIPFAAHSPEVTSGTTAAPRASRLSSGPAPRSQAARGRRLRRRRRSRPTSSGRCRPRCRPSSPPRSPWRSRPRPTRPRLRPCRPRSRP